MTEFLSPAKRDQLRRRLDEIPELAALAEVLHTSPTSGAGMTTPVLDPRPGLPICDHTGLQRLWCNHCDGFTMTQAEYDLYHGNVTTIRHLEAAAGRPLPQYRARYNTWRVETPEATRCDHTTNGTLCPACDLLLDNLLADLPYIVHELGIAQRKAQHFAPRGHHRGNHLPCPTEDCPGTLKPTNEQWQCTHCGHQVEFESALPWNNAASACLRSIRLMEAERNHDRPNLLAALSSLAARGHKVIERPDNQLYLGACPDCSQDMYAERGEPVTCECGHHTTWEAHHEYLLDRLEDRLMTVAEIVTLYQAAGQSISRDRVNYVVRCRRIPTQQLTMAKWRGVLGMRTEPITVVRLGDFRVEHAKRRAG